MGMIGNSLAQGLVSGANIVDGTVDTADIKDAAVTPAKLSTGHPIWESSGELTLPRNNTVSEGGQINFQRAVDGVASWYIDLYGGNTTPILRFVDSSNVRMAIDGSGNVGVGVTSPLQKLDVRGTISANYGANGLGYIQTNGANSDLQITIDNYLTTLANTGSAASLAFATNNTERMRIAANGDVNIGAVASAGDTLRYFDVYNTNTGASAGAIIRLVTSNAAASGNTTVDLIKYKATGFVISNNDTASSNYTAFSVGGVERMRIRYGGNVQIGSTTVSGSRLFVHRNDGGDYGNAQIEMASDTGDVVLGFHAQGTSAVTLRHVRGTGTIQARNVNNTAFAALEASAFTVNSDYRLKENVVPITGALERLLNLPVYRFNFKPYEETGLDAGDKTVDGFLAHEVAEVVPEAAFGEKDAVNEDDTPKYQSIDQSKLVPLLTAAIQEQQTIIEQLKSRIEILEAN